MRTFLVSIIIPMYNSEKTLGRCIKSVIEQTYKNIEIILIDDGSIDNSISLAKKYAQIDLRIKVYSKKNGGPSSARNYGINRASGDFITFVDADDYIHKNMIYEMINEVEQSNDSIVFCGNYEIWKDNIDERLLFLEEDKTLNKSITMREIAIGRAGLVCCKLISSNIIIDHNIKFDENINMCEDLIFYLEVSKYAKYFKNISKALYYYDRTNENSITIKYQPNAYKEQLYIQNRIESIFEQNELINIQDRNILKDRFRHGLWYCINNEFSKYNLKRFHEKIKRCTEIIKKLEIDELFYNDINLDRIDRILYFGIKNRLPLLTSLIFFILVKILLPIKSKLI